MSDSGLRTPPIPPTVKIPSVTWQIVLRDVPKKHTRAISKLGFRRSPNDTSLWITFRRSKKAVYFLIHACQNLQIHGRAFRRTPETAYKPRADGVSVNDHPAGHPFAKEPGADGP